MTKQDENPGQKGCLGSSCLMWVVWSMSLSFLITLSVALLVMLLISMTINTYLAWELSGIQITIRQPGSEPIDVPTPTPTAVLVTAPTNTLIAVSTPTPAEIALVPTLSPLEIELATVAAIATGVATPQESNVSATEIAKATLAPTETPISVPTSVAIGTPAAETSSAEIKFTLTPTPVTVSISPGNPRASVAVDVEQDFVPPQSSSNTYALIPIKGGRESRPAEEHGDLNLKLRDPQPLHVDQLSLIDIDDSGIDPKAPQLSEVFQPDFVNAYTVYDWDWGCNCKGELLQEDHLVLVGIATTPGEPLFIPPVPQAAYGGNYYATLLYASEDSLTFVYDNVGSVTTGYTIHYLGLQTDPNLLALYQESQGNELPGLTLDTPVGTATNELIVAVRDNGTFMDARSKRDWWVK